MSHYIVLIIPKPKFKTDDKNKIYIPNKLGVFIKAWIEIISSILIKRQDKYLNLLLLLIYIYHHTFFFSIFFMKKYKIIIIKILL
jgi:hypothetical protein